MNNRKIEEVNSSSKMSINETSNNSISCDNKPISSYIPKMLKEANKKDLLVRLIQSIEPLDFAIIFNSDNKDICQNIKEFRELLEAESNRQERIALQNKIKKYEPRLEQKIVLIISSMLDIAERLDIEIGVNSSFPYLYEREKGYWALLDTELLEIILAETAKRSGLNILDANNTSVVKKLHEQFLFYGAIPIPLPNNDEIKINLKNGTYVIGKGFRCLKEFDSSDFFKYVLPFDYNQEAEAPLFKKFLNQVVVEKEAQMVMAEYIGYIFAKNLKLETCLVLVGGGANGKSVFYDIVRALLGKENVSSFTLSSLCESNGYSRAELTNVLLNYSSEMGGKNCDPDLIKQLISNEPIGARSPYGKPFTLDNYCRFLFNTNILPRNVEQSDGYFRRFMYLVFDVTIPKQQRDPDLAKKIISTELSGVFNWALEGLDRLLLQKRFTQSPKIESAFDKVKKESNSVALFIDEQNYKPSLDEYINSKNLFSEYVEYCKENYYYPVRKAEFLRLLEMQKIYVKRKATNNATWIYCTNKEKETENHRDTMDLVAKFANASSEKK